MPITKAELDAAIAPLATKAQLGNLQTDVQSKLDNLQANVQSKLDNLRTELQADLQTKLDNLRTDLRDHFVEAIHDAQTELLRGFEFYAKANDGRLRRLEINATTQSSYDAALNERILTLEARMVEVEKRLLK